MKNYVIGFLAFAFLLNCCHAADYQISPIPTWVDTVNSNGSQIQPDPNDCGIAYLLRDVQTKVEQKSFITFTHKIMKILKAENIKDISNIEIEFNPQCETVFLHQVCIKRGHKTFNQILPHNIRVLQREKQLEENVYTGEKSLVVFLEDTRVGDFVEYSYSIENRDFRFAKNFYNRLYLANYMPIVYMRYRLLWPHDLELAIKNHETTINPITNDLMSAKEYIWNFNNIKELTHEENIPSWHLPHPWIEVGAKKHWQEIAAELAEVYKVPDNISNELKSYISETSLKYKNKNDQLLAVVQFIQDKIRYMSIPVDDRRPTDPSVVFKRRYGDCRDKTILALTILKSLGMKALPVLVNTHDGKILNKTLPRSSAFDHVIIQVDADKKKYYFDLTMLFQRGTLENFVQPDYGYVLVLDSKTTALTGASSPLSHLSFRAIYETFDLSKGFDAPGLLSVKTFLKGKNANSAREYLASKDIEKHQKFYLNYYKDFYPSITLKDNLKITDDLDKNEITMVETYEIQNPGILDSSKKKLIFTHYVNEIQPFVTENISLPRTMPLSAPHPIHFLKHVVIHLPKEEWNIEPEKIDVKDSSFYFAKHEQVEQDRFSIAYHYMALADHVTPQNIPAHLENIKHVKDLLGGELSIAVGNVVGDSINWPVLVLTVITSLIMAYACFKIYFFKPKKVMEVPSSPQHQGIRGWLIVLAIMLIVSPFLEVISLKEYLPLILSNNAWNVFLDANLDDYNPYKAPYFLSLLLIVIAEAVYGVLLLFLFFKKKQIFPIAYIVLLWVSPSLWLIIELLNVYIVYEPLNGLYRACGTFGGFIITSTIWTTYLLRSKRVKTTFIHH